MLHPRTTLRLLLVITICICVSFCKKLRKKYVDYCIRDYNLWQFFCKKIQNQNTFLKIFALFITELLLLTSYKIFLGRICKAFQENRNRFSALFVVPDRPALTAA
jgi:hypothetical protein